MKIPWWIVALAMLCAGAAIAFAIVKDRNAAAALAAWKSRADSAAVVSRAADSARAVADSVSVAKQRIADSLSDAALAARDVANSTLANSRKIIDRLRSMIGRTDTAFAFDSAALDSLGSQLENDHIALVADSAALAGKDSLLASKNRSIGSRDDLIASLRGELKIAQSKPTPSAKRFTRFVNAGPEIGARDGSSGIATGITGEAGVSARVIGSAALIARAQYHSAGNPFMLQALAHIEF